MTAEQELTDDEIFDVETEPKESISVVKDIEDDAAPAPEVPKPDEETPTPGEPEEPTLKDVLGKVSVLERERDGLLGAKVAETKKRQAVEAKVNQINETIAGMKARRALPEVETEEETPTPEYIAAEVDFDDDDNPVVKTDSAAIRKLVADEAKKLVDAATKPLADKLNANESQTANQRAVAAQQKLVEDIIGTNEAYPQAFKDIGEQFADLDKLYTRYVQVHGIEGQGPDEAIDLIVSTEIADQFKEKYPGVDPELLVEVRYAPSQAVYSRKLKRALSLTAKPKEEPKPKDTPVASALGKPGNLGSLPAANKSGGASLDDIAGLDFDDTINLSDSEIAKLDRMLQA